MRDAGKTSWIQDWAQSWVQGNVSDVMAVPVGAVLGVLMVIFFYLLYMNYTGDIKHWDGAPAEGALDVFSIDTVGRESSASSPSKSTMKDKDDLTETFAAVDAIERAVQHGNIAGARSVLAQLVQAGTLQQGDEEALVKLIDDAEAENPIADLSKCVASDALTFVTDKGGKILSETTKGDTEFAIMMADFDADAEYADGRGRGLAALKTVEPGEVLLQVPADAQLSIRSAQATPELAAIFKDEAAVAGGVLRSFNGLALFLLHQTHRTDSAFRPYLCSLPLHVPLPFLWLDADLPADFLADTAVMQGRAEVRELVELSYNMTVPHMLAKYPDVFKAEELTTTKWAWACSVILSRSFALKTTGGLFGATTSLENPDVLSPGVLLESFKRPDAAEPAAVHTLVPAVDMANHESNQTLRCELGVAPDGSILVTAGPSGLQRGFEIAVSYSDRLCGIAALNRWGFVMPPCAGDSNDGAGKQE